MSEEQKKNSWLDAAAKGYAAVMNTVRWSLENASVNSITVSALASLLVEKGIITEKEMNDEMERLVKLQAEDPTKEEDKKDEAEK